MLTLNRLHTIMLEKGLMEMNTDLIELLSRFNRKERFFLVGNALGKKDFSLSCGFRKRLQHAVGLDECIPAHAFVAMDYHLDWIAAALTVFAKDDKSKVFGNCEIDGTKLVMGNQEDVDFLVCFKGNDSNYNLILLEAKGYSSWSSVQMESKMTRFRRIFGDKGDRIAGVKPIFCLTSPRPPQQLKYGEWPEWCKPANKKPYWLELPIPVNRRLVGRCDAEGNSAEHGQYFHIYAG
ncbi:MAG: hypothetical protein OXI16_01405 [Chloroflexota bacterium]|nr:hypothetical protein [Chloroflexota bacterium]